MAEATTISPPEAPPSNEVTDADLKAAFDGAFIRFPSERVKKYTPVKGDMVVLIDGQTMTQNPNFPVRMLPALALTRSRSGDRYLFNQTHPAGNVAPESIEVVFGPEGTSMAVRSILQKSPEYAPLDGFTRERLFGYFSNPNLVDRRTVLDNTEAENRRQTQIQRRKFWGQVFGKLLRK
ncbi:MAG TPA: hypothetical protein VFB03_01155 [Candidatus Saccharimonadales bacterium]|nr:hypothetical protein [Candidatus Saccharimonadales bacterium]